MADESEHSYVTVEEFMEMFDTREVVELSSLFDPGNCEINRPKIEQELIRASRFADSYIRVRYETPVVPTPLELRRKVAEIARYHLATLASEESRICYDFKGALSYLKDISKGAVHLDLVDGDDIQPHTDNVQSIPGMSVEFGGFSNGFNGFMGGLYGY